MKYRKVNKILLIRMRSIGDLITITPCTRAVKKKYPECYLSVLVEKGFEDIFIGNPYVDEILILDKIKNKSLLNQWKFISKVRSIKFDMIINLHGGPRSTIIVLFSGAKYRVGGLQKSHHLNWIYNIRVRPFNEVLKKNEQSHIVNRHLATLKCAGIESANNGLQFNIGEDNLKYINQLFVEKGLENRQIVSFYFPATSKIKRMTEEKVACIADEIIEKYQFSVIFIGAESDKKFNDNVIDNMKHEAVNFAGKTTIGQVGALLSRSLFFLGLDSGPAHVAAAAGTYVVSLFGSTSVKTWHPWTEKLLIIRKEISCIGCGKNVCEYGDLPLCLEGITPGEILGAMEKDNVLQNIIKQKC